ncbi:MAG: hypothetical protein K2X77_16015 [Candidatus Obscuribacterales bacterium]|nr:hypothetical protein [Candidatus Obscuribacterales bacterium]
MEYTVSLLDYAAIQPESSLDYTVTGIGKSLILVLWNQWVCVMTIGVQNLSKAQQAYLKSDPNMASLGRAARTVDPLNRLPALPYMSTEHLERELANPELSASERSAAKLVRDNFALIETLAFGSSDKAVLSDAANDLSHLHALKFTTDVLWSKLIDLLERCANSGFAGRDGYIRGEDFNRFSTANPCASGIKFIVTALRVRKELGFPDLHVNELHTLKPSDFYRPLQLSYLAARVNDAAFSKVVGWVGAAAGAMLGGFAGALFGGAIAYVAWTKSTQVLNMARALELLNELESRGLKRYFDKAENPLEFSV